MLYAFYHSVWKGLELTHRSEIEDTAEMIFVFETLNVSIACIVQVRSAKESMRFDGPSSGPRDTAKVAGIIYMFEKDVQWCMVYGVRCMVYGVWCTVYGVRCTVYGVWCINV